MYVYPYGDSQQLNLDWIINKLKELENRGTSAADLEEIANVFIALTHSSGTQYRRYDYCYYQGKLYRALNDNIGAFNASDWMEVRLGDDIPVLTRLINAIDAAAVVDVKFDTSETNGKLQQKYNNAYHDVVEVDYTPVQNSKRPLSSNAGYDLNTAINDEKAKMPYLDGTTSTAITVANGSTTNPGNTDAVYTVEHIAIKSGQVATVKVLRNPKTNGDKFVFGSIIRNSADEQIIYWDYNINSTDRCSVKCDVPIVGGYVQFTIAESNGNSYTQLRESDFSSGDVVISVEDAETLPEYSESFSSAPFTSGQDLNYAAKVKICSYNVAKYNCDTTVQMNNEKILNFRKLLDAYQFDYLCVQEDTHYYDNSSKDALNYLYYPILPEYYRQGTHYETNIHSTRLATGTPQKVMFTGVSSTSRGMQICVFPIDDSNKKLLVCDVHCPWNDLGTGAASVEMITLRNSVYTEIFQFINGDIQLNNVSGTAVSVPAHDYAVVCMDANCATDTDKSNLLSAASAKNFKPANGGKFGWFNTCHDPDFLGALDNIFVSNNIEFSKIEPLWSWYNDLYSDHVPLMAELLLINAKEIIDIGITSATTVNAGSYVDIPITFSKKFTQAPKVICSLYSDSSSSDLGSVEACVFPPVSTTGATIRLFNNASAGRTPQIVWFAVGT